MRNWVRLFAVIFIIAGASPAFAAPLSSNPSSFSPRISIALPAATIDFSDLDMRDEFNRPIAVRVIRERFEEVLNRELNHLLLENLTPLRRAWMDLLDHAANAFGAGLGRVFDHATQVLKAVLRDSGWMTAFASRGATARVADDSRDGSSDAGASHSLALQSISTTRLLR